MVHSLLSGREVSLAYKHARLMASRLRSLVDVWQVFEEDWKLVSRVSSRFGEKVDFDSDNEALPPSSIDRLKSSEFASLQTDETIIVAWKVPGSPLLISAKLPNATTLNDEHMKSLFEITWDLILEQESLLQANVQSEAYVQQITQDFEELTWLRRISQQLCKSDPRIPLHSIAESFLKNLAPMLGAETVSYIPAEVIEDFDILRESDSAPKIAVIRHGNRQPTSQQLVEVARVVAKKTIDKAWICNSRNNYGRLESIPGIDNLIAVPVINGGWCYGWVIAVNKRQPIQFPENTDYCLVDSNTNNFGTFEGGLVMTAANLIAAHARNHQLFQEQQETISGVIRAFINAIDAKDTYTYGHSDRVATIAKCISEKLGFSTAECEQIYMAGLLHDIGKIGIPDSILTKPGKLTDEEYTIVKKHPEIGYTILKHLKQLEYVLPGVLHHHEAVNGSGYPHRLIGEAIPIHGRILAVADAYDAMTSDRPYRKGMPSERAEKILHEESGKTWDEVVVQAMQICIDEGIFDATGLNERSVGEDKIAGIVSRLAQTNQVPVLS